MNPLSKLGKSAEQTQGFLPVEYVKANAERRGNILALVLFVLVLSGTVGAFMVTNRHWSIVRGTQEAVNDQFVTESKRIEQLKALEEQRDQIMEKAEIAASLLEAVPRWALLAELTMRMPLNGGMTLSDVRLTSRRLEGVREAAPAPRVRSLSEGRSGKSRGKRGEAKRAERPRIIPPRFEYTLVIRGVAEVNSHITDFAASLRRSPALRDVELVVIDQATRESENVRKFEIAAKVRTDAEEESLAASLTELLERRTTVLKGRAAERASAQGDVGGGN